MRWGSTVILLALALPTLLVSASNIKTQIGAGSLLLLAREVESSEKVSSERVETVLVDAAQWGIVNSCQDDVSRAVTTLHVYLLNGALSTATGLDETQVLARRALLAVEQRLKCTPGDGNAWLIRAQVLQVLEPGSPEVRVSMLNSYHFAPSESWIMGPRFEFAVAHYDFVQQNLEKEFQADLRRQVFYAPPDVVAADYVKANGEVRAMIYHALTGQPQLRRDAVASNADRLGVTLGGWSPATRIKPSRRGLTTSHQALLIT